MKEKAGKYENLSQEMEQKIEKVINDLENDFNFDYIEKVLEASIRFPDDDHAESIKKLEELKESQEGG